MPKSLRNKIKHLAYKGELNERERDRILNALDREVKWIPVSERLPEEYNHVLCQFCMGGMAECYYANNFFHVVGGLRINSDEVVAWMPLPTPYQPPKMMCEED